MAETVDWDEVARAGWALRDHPDDMLAYLKAICDARPDAGRAHFELANALDALGREAEAIPAYERALALGLERPWDLYALLQLGSSLRNVGRPSEAVGVLERAVRLDPGYAASRLFHCLALKSAGRPVPALVEALRFLLDHADPDTGARYGDLLRRYVDELAAEG